MLQNIKALVVVLIIAGLAFAAIRPTAIKFMSAEDFNRRRSMWLALTIAAFLSPSFWLYTSIALPVIVWGYKREKNPAALYLLLFYAVPSFALQIPIIGINQLFDLSHQRILAVGLLAPWAFRIYQEEPQKSMTRFRWLDWTIIAYLSLTIVLSIPFESFTNTLRRAFLVCLDTGMTYYVFSRMKAEREKIIEAMAALFMSCLLMASVAAFETSRKWLLYTNIGEIWGNPNVFAFLLREDHLRAQAAAGHSLALGYILAIGFGFWLYLSSRSQSRSVSWAVGLWLWIGLLATFSRGPWLTAILLGITFLALRPDASASLLKGLVLSCVAAAVVFLSPLGDQVISYLPFVGTVDSENVSYRQQLFNTAVMLVADAPFFGSPFVLHQMEHMRQGQGIIDLMNGYVQVALFYGLVGLTLFIGSFLLSIYYAFRVWKAQRQEDRDLVLLGACLIACMVASIFFIATASYGTIQYVLIGLLASYGRLQSRHGKGSLSAAQAQLARGPWSGLPPRG